MEGSNSVLLVWQLRNFDSCVSVPQLELEGKLVKDLSCLLVRCHEPFEQYKL